MKTLGRKYGGHGGAMAVQGQELDFESGSLAVDVDDGPDVPGLQTSGAEVAREYDSIVFIEHGFSEVDTR